MDNNRDKETSRAKIKAKQGTHIKFINSDLREEIKGWNIIEVVPNESEIIFDVIYDRCVSGRPVFTLILEKNKQRKIVTFDFRAYIPDEETPYFVYEPSKTEKE